MELFGLTAEDFISSTDETLKRLILEVTADAGKEALSCVLQDLLKGRLTEVGDYFNGLIVKKGREVNVATPINEMVTSLMREIEQGSGNYYETEIIDNNKAFNEYLLTALRTKWGIDMDHIAEEFGSAIKNSCLEKIHTFNSDELFIREGVKYSLSRKGKLISDYIISELVV